MQYLSKKVDECVDEINLSDSSKIITSGQASAITANTAKTGITSTQASRITANHSKVGITSTQAGHITANNAKVGTNIDLMGGKVDGTTLTASVKVVEENYIITFTMVDSTGRSKVTKTASITMS